MTYTVQQFAAVSSLDDADAVKQARDTVYARVMQAVHDVRHGKVEFLVIPAAAEGEWRGALADVALDTEQTRAARDGLVAFMESDPGCALIVAQCSVYGGAQQRSKANLS